MATRNKSPDGEKIMLTVKEASEIYGISPHAIRRWIKENAFPAVHTGRKIFINRMVFFNFLGGAYNEKCCTF